MENLSFANFLIYRPKPYFKKVSDKNEKTIILLNLCFLMDNGLALPATQISSAPTKTIYNPYHKTYVKRLFNKMSGSYEKMNYLTSFGFSYFWRKQFLQYLPHKEESIQVVDLMTGMGETWSHIFKKWQKVQLTALDFSEGMLQYAAQKNQTIYNQQVTLLKEDVLGNSLPDNHFDVVTCAFGIKTFDACQLQELARETCRILKPNGHFSFIEISEPSFKWLRLPYLLYIRHIVPSLGHLFAEELASYKMLGYYTRMFGNAKKAVEIFKQAGLTVTYKRFFGGCATGFYGSKNDLLSHH